MIFDHIEESSDKLIIFYSQHLVDVILCILENVVSDTFYCGTVCYGICTVQCNRLARGKCHCHAWRSSRLNTYYFNLRIQHFCKCRYTCDQSAATNWCKNIINGWKLLHNFHCNTSLTCYDVQIIKRMHKCTSALLGQFFGIRTGIIIDISVKNHLCAVAFCTIYFDQWCYCWHNDCSLTSEFLCCVCNTLCMVSG